MRCSQGLLEQALYCAVSTPVVTRLCGACQEYAALVALQLRCQLQQ